MVEENQPTGRHNSCEQKIVPCHQQNPNQNLLSVLEYIFRFWFV